MHATAHSRRWLARLSCPALACLLLTGCPLLGEGDNSKITARSALQSSAGTRPRVPALEPPKAFAPKDYAASTAVSPFDPLKLIGVLRSSTRANDTRLIDAERNRRKEPLEDIPLDGMAMVGSLQKSGAPTALVRVNDLLYQVHLGNYLGQNYGKVTQITETSIQLREIVQDGAGDWVERSSTLHLKEEG